MVAKKRRGFRGRRSLFSPWPTQRGVHFARWEHLSVSGDDEPYEN
jgi:hypothetical protein